MGMNRIVAFTSLLPSAEYLKQTLARRRVECVELIDVAVSDTTRSEHFGPLQAYAEANSKALRYSSDDLDTTAKILEKIGPDFLFYGFEHNLITTDRLANMVCPCFANDPATAAAREWKDKTNQHLAAHGFRVAREVAFTSNQHLDSSHFADLPDRLILKTSRYSANHPVMSKDALMTWLNTQKRRSHPTETHFSAQELLIDFDIHGMQKSYSIDGFAIAGKHTFVSLQLWLKHVLDDQFLYCWADQLDLNDPVNAPLLKHAQEVLSVLGLNNGFFHSDFTLTPEGPVLVDLNPRIAGGGGIVDKMITASQGLGVIDSFINTAYGEQHPFPQQKTHVRLLAIYGLSEKEFDEVTKYQSYFDFFDSSDDVGCHFILFASIDRKTVAMDADSCFQRFVAPKLIKAKTPRY